MMNQVGTEMAGEFEQDDRGALLLKLAQDAYSGSSSFFDANVRDRIINDIRQFNSEHPLGSKYLTDSYKLRSKFFRPKTRTAIRTNEAVAAAAYFSSEDVVAVRPHDDSDDLHRAAADVHHALLQYRLTQPKPKGIPWFLTCMGAYQEAQSVGVVCSIQDWIYNEQKGIDRPDVTTIPVENFRFDPAADWRDVVESSPYFIIMWPMYVKDIKARMAKPVMELVDFENEDGSVIQIEELSWDKNGRPWKYYDDAVLKTAMMTNDTVRDARESGATDSKQPVTAINDFSVVWVHQNFVEIDGEEVFFYTLGTSQLLSDETPVRQRYPQGMPVVVGFSIIEAHKAYKSSVSSLERQTQAELNDNANLRMDNVKLGLQKRYFVKKSKGVDLRSLTRNIPGSVTMMTDLNDVKVVTTDLQTGTSYQEQDRLNLDFDDLAGTFSGSSVQSNRSLNETVGGMNLIADKASMVGEYQLRTFTETWVEPALRQIVMLEQAYETDEMVLRIAGRKAKIKKYGFEALTDEIINQETILNVSVGTGATNPQTQLTRFTYGLGELAKFLGPAFMQRIKPDEIIEEMFGKLGYKDGKRFFDGFDDEDQQVDPRLQQAMQMVEQLKQQLAQKHPPELIAAQVNKTNAEAANKKADTALKEIQKVAKAVESLYSAMNTAKTAVETPGVTPVADAIAKSAGFVDADNGEIYPEQQREAVAAAGNPVPENTSPNFPPNADRGMLNGIEGGHNSENVVQ